MILIKSNLYSVATLGGRWQVPARGATSRSLILLVAFWLAWIIPYLVAIRVNLSSSLQLIMGNGVIGISYWNDGSGVGPYGGVGVESIEVLATPSWLLSYNEFSAAGIRSIEFAFPWWFTLPVPITLGALCWLRMRLCSDPLVCVRCGYILNGAMFCPECGTKRDHRT